MMDIPYCHIKTLQNTITCDVFIYQLCQNKLNCVAPPPPPAHTHTHFNNLETFMKATVRHNTIN